MESQDTSQIQEISEEISQKIHDDNSQKIHDDNSQKIHEDEFIMSQDIDTMPVPNLLEKESNETPVDVEMLPSTPTSPNLMQIAQENEDESDNSSDIERELQKERVLEKEIQSQSQSQSQSQVLSPTSEKPLLRMKRAQAHKLENTEYDDFLGVEMEQILASGIVK